MKVILLDLDGIVIRPRNHFFSEKYSEEYGVSIEEIRPFFVGEFKKAAIGEVGIRDVLPNYLSKWEWKGTLDEFLKYWFESEKDIDSEILKKVKELRSGGIKVYIVSDNEKERAIFLMNNLNLKEEFDGAFFSCELGYTKSDPKFFEKVISELNVDAKEISYWDDDIKNVEVAKSLGINGNLYTTFEGFNKDLSSN